MGNWLLVDQTVQVVEIVEDAKISKSHTTISRFQVSGVGCQEVKAKMLKPAFWDLTTGSLLYAPCLFKSAIPNSDL
jgi:hypothetical protein